MVDNTTLNAGTGGDVIASDDIGGVKHQRVKIEYGVDGAATDVSDTNPLPIDDAGGSITVDGTVSLGAGTAEIGKLAAGVASIGTVVLGAGTAEVGKLAAGVAEIGNVKNSGTFAVQVNGAALTALQLIDDAISGTEMQVDVVAALPAGANLIGDVGISGARTSGGTTPYKNLDVDETEDEIKGTAGQVYWIHAINLAATKRYLKFYNATAAVVVVGTTVPVLTFPIPTQGDTNGAGFNFSVPNGIAFGTAITIAATTGFADADTGAPGANEVIVNIGYA